MSEISNSPLDVLYEDNHCLAVNKPARLLTAGDKTGDESLLDQAREYLRQKYQKPGNVFLGLVHRLDRPVSGVVLFARTSKAAGRLSEQFRESTVDKVYQAIVEGVLPQPCGRLVDWVIKDEESNTVRRVSPVNAGARECILDYSTLQQVRGLSLVELRPITGRSHQLRVQLAGQGTPIYGDGKYGSKHAWGGVIALHSAQLSFDHPIHKQRVQLQAPLPESWTRLLRPA